MTKEQAEEFMEDFLLSAIVKFPNCKNDLSDRNSTGKTFNKTLTETEEEILSKLMVIEWLEPMINNVMLLKQALSDSDFKLYSQSQHLDEMLTLKDKSLIEIDNLIIQYTYSSTNDFSRLG
jgi:hypothetical protein